MYPQAPGFSLQDWEEVGGGEVWMRPKGTGKEIQCTPFGEFS